MSLFTTLNINDLSINDLSINDESKSIEINKEVETSTMVCRINGIIELNKVSKYVIQHRVFARLKNIAQLGTMQFNLPYVTHSRYEHSIGVAYLASFTGKSLQKKHPSITDKEILCLELAGLCHDLGHGPFSHLFDSLLKDLSIPSVHEKRSQLLFRFIINDLKLNEEIFNGADINLVEYFIDAKQYEKSDPDLKLLPVYFKGLEQIVCNTLNKFDVDKMDYLIRDALFLRYDNLLPSINKNGIKNGDIKDLLSRTMIINNEWIFHADDQSYIHTLISSRFIFYANGYLRHDMAAVSCMLEEAIKETNIKYDFTTSVKLDTAYDIEQFCKLTDSYMIETILNSDILSAVDLVKRLISGNNLYKHVGDYTSKIPNIDLDMYHISNMNLLTDKSNPLIMLPKINYHKNDKIISNVRDINIISRVFNKSAQSIY